MGKDKNLEDTQDLDVKTIRSVSSKSVQRKKTKNEISKGGSSRSRSASSEKKRTASSPKKSVNQSSQSRKAPVKSSASKNTHTTKVRRFPKEELQKQNTSKKTSAKRKKTMRKVKGILIFSLVCTIVVALLAIFAVSQLFKIKTVTVNYDLNKTSQSENVKRKYTDEQIITAAGVGEGNNLLLAKYAKADDIMQSVSKQLPFLKVVSVDSKGMSELIVSVKQIKPSYAFMFGETYILTDDSMNIIDHTQDKETALQYCVVRYADISSHETGQKLTLSERSNEQTAVESVFSAIKAAELKNITYISLKNLDDLYMTYDNRILVHVGNRNNLVEKLKLAQRSLADEDKNSLQQKGELNLTVEKKAYFTPQ